MNVSTNRYSAFNVSSLRSETSFACEIGAKCLFFREQTAKIAQNIFHTFSDTYCRMLFRYFCASVVLCGALTLTYLIVKVCWKRYPSPNSNLPDKSSRIFSKVCEYFPYELTKKIFYDFNLADLGACSRVNKNWNKHINLSDLWRRAIYQDYAFTSADWARWGLELVKDIDLEEEMLSLPENIVDELRRAHAAFPGKSIKDSHVLVRTPKGFKISIFVKHTNEYDIIVKFGPGRFNHGHHACFQYCTKLIITAAEESVWLLMASRKDNSSRLSFYEEQKNAVAELAKRNQIAYEVPTLLEAVTCVLADCFRSKTHSKKRLLSVYTYCQDNSFKGYRPVITASICHSNTIYINLEKGELDSYSTVTALRRFSSSAGKGQNAIIGN